MTLTPVRTPKVCARPGCTRSSVSTVDGLCTVHRRALGMHRRDAGPVTARIREHLATGIAVDELARRAGLAHSTVWRLAQGQQSVSTATWEKIMALPVEAPRGGYRPAIGARRRVQALLAAGWRREDLAAMTGLDESSLSNLAAGRHETVYPATDDRVRGVYAALEWCPVRPASSRIRHRGWALPAQWDPETIDDPEVSPVPVDECTDQGGRVDSVRVARALKFYSGRLDESPRRRIAKSERPALTVAERRQVATTLARDYAPTAVADALGCNGSSVREWIGGAA